MQKTLIGKFTIYCSLGFVVHAKWLGLGTIPAKVKIELHNLNIEMEANWNLVSFLVLVPTE